MAPDTLICINQNSLILCHKRITKELLVLLEGCSRHAPTIHALHMHRSLRGFLNHPGIPSRVLRMATNTSAFEFDVFVIPHNTCMFVVERSKVESPLENLPAAHNVSYPHSYRGFADVPKLVDGCLRRSEIVVSILYC